MSCGEFPTQAKYDDFLTCCRVLANAVALAANVYARCKFGPGCSQTETIKDNETRETK